MNYSIALRYNTFLRRWNSKWTLILKFRDRSMFSQCDICQELKKQPLAQNTFSFLNVFGFSFFHHCCILSGCCLTFPIVSDGFSSPFQVSGQNSFDGHPAWSSTTLPCSPGIPICRQMCILGSQGHKFRCHGPNHHHHNRWC